jgi:uncharacterized protein YggE
MKKNVLIALLGAVLVVALAGCQAAAPAASSATRQISASGSGKVYVVPDMAYVYIGVHSEAADVASALADNNTQAQAISEALQAQGVAAEDIQTSAFNVYPQQNYSPEGKALDTIYAVDNTVYVIVRDLSKLGSLLDASVQAGANQINGISFDVADRASAEAQARKIAVDNAKASASELAGLAGVQLGDLLTINVTDSGTPSPMYAADSARASAGATIAAGQLVIQVDANLSYEIK